MFYGARQHAHPRYNFEGPREQVVGNMFTAVPREGERYFLRIHFQHISPGKSFRYLRIVDEILYSTDRKTCARVGLISDDDEWRRAIRDSFVSSLQLLFHLFATIIAQCFPVDPLNLYTDALHMLIENLGNDLEVNKGSTTQMKQQNMYCTRYNVHFSQ